MHGVFALRYMVLNAHKLHTEIKGTEFAQISHQGQSILAYQTHNLCEWAGKVLASLAATHI